MAYTHGKSKFKDTYEYWSLWDKKNRNVEKHFLAQWQKQFDEIREICRSIEIKGHKNDETGLDHEEPYYSILLGSVFSVTPSGKFYMPFASSNVSMKEAAIDMFWQEKFEEILSEEDCWQESGEGDPCDIFICKACKRTVEGMTNEDFQQILIGRVLPDLTPADYIAIPGIYEILSEYYNDDVIDIYLEGGNDAT